jgi:hypothetical protein
MDQEHPIAQAVRLFAGFAGLGAALVNFSIASGMFALADGTGKALLVASAVGTVAWGAVLLGWSLAGLYRARLLLPRLAVPLLLAAAAVHIVVLASGFTAARMVDLSHLAGLLLTLMAVAAAGWLRNFRRRAHVTVQDTVDGGAAAGSPAAAGGRPGRVLLLAFAGAVAVAAVATPGLAASVPGQYAVPHSGHGPGLDDGGKDMAEHRPADGHHR